MSMSRIELVSLQNVELEHSFLLVGGVIYHQQRVYIASE